MTKVIAINVVGSEKGIKNILQMIYQSTEVTANNVQRGSSRRLAGFITTLAKSKAPYSGRKGGIRDNIVNERVSNGRYRIYVKTPKRWGSEKSKDARFIYPLAQERGYKPHRIHTSMIPREIRWKYLKGATKDGSGKNMGAEKGRIIMVKGFRPYMLPAYIESLQLAPRVLNAIIRKELRSLTKSLTRKYAKAGMVPGPLAVLSPLHSDIRVVGTDAMGEAITEDFGRNPGGVFPALATIPQMRDYDAGKRTRRSGWKYAKE